MPEASSAPGDIASVSIDDLGTVMVVRMTGEIDASTAKVVGGPLFSCLDAVSCAVIVDLTSVEFIGSTGLTILVRACRTARARAIALRVVAGTQAVLRPMQVCGLDTYLPLSSCVSDALDSLGVGRNVDAGR
jgi:anti-sigma B factor antagonist